MQGPQTAVQSGGGKPARGNQSRVGLGSWWIPGWWEILSRKSRVVTWRPKLQAIFNNWEGDFPKSLHFAALGAPRAVFLLSAKYQGLPVGMCFTLEKLMGTLAPCG